MNKIPKITVVSPPPKPIYPAGLKLTAIPQGQPLCVVVAGHATPGAAELSQMCITTQWPAKRQNWSEWSWGTLRLKGRRGRTSKTYSTLAVQKMKELKPGSVGVNGSPGGRGPTLLGPVASIFVPLQARTELPLARGSVAIWGADTVPELLLSWVPKSPPRHRGEERAYMHT